MHSAGLSFVPVLRKSRGVFDYRESSVSVGPLVVRYDELPCEVFENSPQILQHVSKDRSMAMGELDHLLDGENKDVVLRIEVFDEGYDLILIQKPCSARYRASPSVLLRASTSPSSYRMRPQSRAWRVGKHG